MTPKKTATQKEQVKDYIVKKPFFEQIIRWKPNDVIKLTEQRAKEIGIPKYVVPVGYKEPEKKKRFFSIDKDKKKTDAKTREASKSVLDNMLPGVTDGL
jgi:hypothetical protein